MKIEIRVDENADDIDVVVTCKHLTSEVEKIISALRLLDKQLIVKKGVETFLLDIEKIIYIESVDRKCFIYTDMEVFESDYKLYELEKQFEEDGFFRVSKACLIRLKSIHSLRADIDRRIRITMSNGEQLIASRFYADELKKRLGVK